MAEQGIRTIDDISSNDLYNKYLGWIDEYNTNPEYVAEFISRVGVKIDKPNAVLSEAHLEFIENADLNAPDWQKAKETSQNNQVTPWQTRDKRLAACLRILFCPLPGRASNDVCCPLGLFGRR